MFPPPSIISHDLDTGRPRTSIDTERVHAARPSRRSSAVRSAGWCAVGFSLAAIWVASGAPLEARLTLTVFVGAVVLWTATDIDDTLVALGAAAIATVAAGSDVERFHSALGSSTVWLLIASFVVAAGVQRSGLATMAIDAMLRNATTVTGVFWRTTVALGALTFAIPATSGRAALALPMYAALSRRIERVQVRRALALLFPTIILLSASASLLGAGAHLVAMDLVDAVGGEPLGFMRWALLALPYTILSCAAATVAVLHLFVDPDVRRFPVEAAAPRSDDGNRFVRRRVATVLAAVLSAWCTSGITGFDPALVAVFGALAICVPGRGGVRLGDALDEIPWSLVVFLAATTALGDTLLESGAADWLGNSALGHVRHLPVPVIVVAIVSASLVAHLVVGSRSARASVLVPIVLVTAAAAGIDPTALVFASTMAAGYCLTLPVSAKPVAMFQYPAGRSEAPAYDSSDLLRLSVVLLPLHLVLITAFTLGVWPVLGLEL